MLRSLPSWIVFLALGATGCTRTMLVPERYQLPVSENPKTARAQSACIASCRPVYEAGPVEYGTCLAGCPGMQIAERAACDPGDAPSSTWCYEMMQEREVYDAESTEVALDVFGSILEAIVEGAAADDDSDDDEVRHHRKHEKKRVVKARSPIPRKGGRSHRM